MNKFKLYAASASGVIAGIVGVALAHAQSVPAGAIVVPTSTATDLLASIGNIFTDPGVLAVVIVAVAIPLFFYFVHQLMGLLPKSRGGKRS